MTTLNKAALALLLSATATFSAVSQVYVDQSWSIAATEPDSLMWSAGAGDCFDFQFDDCHFGIEWRNVLPIYLSPCYNPNNANGCRVPGAG